ncbi:hypothetical protein [Cereibacter sphaeroides]|uniref:hypothetical protein n=1 Tax=Cereibacter sphaeroides TaxID=1063 RepID=UPI001359E6B9
MAQAVYSADAILALPFVFGIDFRKPRLGVSGVDVLAICYLLCFGCFHPVCSCIGQR